MSFAHPIDFFALPILKKIRIYQVWFLFGMSPGVDSYSRLFETISLVWVLVLILIRAFLKQSINNKMVSKI